MFMSDPVQSRRSSVEVKVAEAQISVPFVMALLGKTDQEQRRILSRLSQPALDKLKKYLLELAGRSDSDRLSGEAATTLFRLGSVTRRLAFYFVMADRPGARQGITSQLNSQSADRLRELIYEMGVDYLRFHAAYSGNRLLLEQQLSGLLKPTYVPDPVSPGWTNSMKVSDPLGQYPERTILPFSSYPP